MKILLAQINTTVGALEANRQKILKVIENGRALGADLIVLPELATTGYPPKDLLLSRSFVHRNLQVLESLAAETPGIAIIVGFVDVSRRRSGKGLCNSAALIADGKIVSRHNKMLLPTYDVFDEGRYFDPAESVRAAEFRGMRLGISICEDIWNDELYWKHRIYRKDPIKELCGQGVDAIINISASPFTLNKRGIKEGMFRNTATRYGKPVIHVNLVGGNDSLIFDGWSNVFSERGEIVAQARDFAEDFVLYDTERETADKHPTASEGMECLLEALKLGLRDYVTKCGFKRVVIGLSGGLDSSVVAALAALALGKEQVLGVSMPSQFTSRQSITDAEALARNLGIQLKIIPIQDIYESYLATLKPEFRDLPFGIAEENIQARIRGNLLMALSNKFGYLVLSTGNKSEIATGYCTLYGDLTGGLAVISDVPKTMVYELAGYLNRDGEVIPQAVIKKAPSAELRPNQKDQDTLPPYEVLDKIITAYIEEQRGIEEIAAMGFSEEFVKDVVRKIDGAEYKRMQAPPGLKVTTRAFGYGRRMPIARGE
jgi:NAD+ synthase (glutamine-hydrolysing)